MIIPFGNFAGGCGCCNLLCFFTTNDNFEAGVCSLELLIEIISTSACERLSGTHKYNLVSGLSGGSWAHMLS